MNTLAQFSMGLQKKHMGRKRVAPVTHSLRFLIFKKNANLFSQLIFPLAIAGSQLGFGLKSLSLQLWEAAAGESSPCWDGAGTYRDATTGHITPRPWGVSKAGCISAVNCCFGLQRGPPCQQTPSASISSTQSHPQTPMRSLFAHCPLISSPRGRRNGKNSRYPPSFGYCKSVFLRNIYRNCLPRQLGNTVPWREGHGKLASTVSDCICLTGVTLSLAADL